MEIHRIGGSLGALVTGVDFREPLTPSGYGQLFVAGSFMDEIVDMHRSESDVLLAYLRGRVDDPNVQCRWQWRANDLAIWDERCTNHRALSDHYPQHRLMRRCTVDSTRLPAGWDPM